MTIVAIIPARAASRGLPGKNTAIVAGKPMFLHSVEAALGCRYVDDVWVSTDSYAVERDTRGTGAYVHTRPAHLSQDDSSMKDVLVDFASAQGLSDEDVLMVLYPVYPTRTAQHLDAIVGAFDGRPLLGLHQPRTHPYLCMQLAEGTVSKLIDHRLYRRQDYPECWEVTHAACLLPVGYLEGVDDMLMCEETQPFFVPDEWQLVNVDSAADMERARAVMEGRC